MPVFSVVGSIVGGVALPTVNEGVGVLSPFLPTWKAMRQSLAAGNVVHPKIACVGNSKTAGVGTHATLGNTGYRINSWPYYMAQRLAALGLPVTT